MFNLIYNQIYQNSSDFYLKSIEKEVKSKYLEYLSNNKKIIFFEINNKKINLCELRKSMYMDVSEFLKNPIHIGSYGMKKYIIHINKFENIDIKFFYYYYMKFTLYYNRHEYSRALESLTFKIEDFIRKDRKFIFKDYNISYGNEMSILNKKNLENFIIKALQVRNIDWDEEKLQKIYEQLLVIKSGNPYSLWKYMQENENNNMELP